MLSIIVPVYNTETYLIQCIESILTQDYKDIELILVDDGSTDGSRSICDNYACKDSRVTAYHIMNSGSFNARRYGVEKARGEFVTFVDADDFISEKSYSMAVNEMDNKIDVICFGINRYYSVDWIIEDYDLYDEDVYDKDKIKKYIFPNMIYDFKKDTSALCPSLCNKIVKKDLFLDFSKKYHDLDIYFGDDALAVYSIVSHATTMFITHKAYYYHRQRMQSQVSPRLIKPDFYDKLYTFFITFRHELSDDIFAQQIEAYYIKFIDMKKKLLPYSKLQYYLFPFGKVEKASKIVIYGAGMLGGIYVDQIKKTGYCEIVAWVDKNYENYSDRDVSSVDVISSSVNFDYIVIAIENKKICGEVSDMLQTLYHVGKDMIII